MAQVFAVAVETGQRRSFAQAGAWPGFCRSGRTEADAVGALLAYGPRFQRVVASAGLEFVPPQLAEVKVVERIEGGPVTDFGAITRPIGSDREPLTTAHRERLGRLLQAAWRAFDTQYGRVPARERAEKPRVGRSADGLRLHLVETDHWHLRAFGGPLRKMLPEALLADEERIREAIVERVGELPLGQPFVPARRHGLEWTPVFAARRSIWHALDHAWQIEDRLG